MVTAEAVQGSRERRTAASLVALLALAIFINYIDRGNLATAAPLIKDEFGLTTFQIGVMTSAFFWIYTPSQLLAAWLADKLNPYRALALGFAIWSGATALTGFATGFASLVALRLLLGLGESAAFPCMSKLLARHVPPQSLGVANGFTQAGISYGPALGTILGGVLMVHLGWRAMFILFGAAALLWLWPWAIATRDAAATIDRTPETPPSFHRLLSLRAMWGAVIGHFSSNYTLYFVLSWLPLYLVKERGFTVLQMAQIGATVYLVAGTSSIASGWLADRWIASGAPLNRVRKAALVTGHLAMAACLAGVALGSQSAAVVSLLLYGICSGLVGPSLWATAQTLAGPRAAARWVGVQNCLANFAGILGPLITGAIVDRTGSFTDALLFASAMAVIGAVGWGLIVRRVEPVRWETVA